MEPDISDDSTIQISGYSPTEGLSSISGSTSHPPTKAFSFFAETLVYSRGTICLPHVWPAAQQAQGGDC